MNRLKKAFQILVAFERALGAILLFVILAVVFIATVGRYTTLFRVLFSEELARFCMIWLVFIGAAVCGLEGNLFNVDLITPRLSPKGKVVFLIIRLLLTVGFCVFATYFGIEMIQRQLILNQKSAMMGVPYAFMYSSVPVGCMLIALHYIIRTIIDLAEVKRSAGQSVIEEGGHV